MTIKALGVKNVLLFDLMSVLTMQALLHGLESVYALGVLDKEAELTILGKEMYVFVVVVVLLIYCKLFHSRDSSQIIFHERIYLPTNPRFQQCVD